MGHVSPFRHLRSKRFPMILGTFQSNVFWPDNRPLKIQESIGIPTPKVGTHLGMWGFIPSHSPALPGAWNVIPGLHSWPAPLQALALVWSPRSRLRHYGCLSHCDRWSLVSTHHPCLIPPILGHLCDTFFLTLIWNNHQRWMKLWCMAFNVL
jgi:hypothetical protein